nr:hypothetical protein [Tanacetum cinerariifolium]
IKEGLNNILKNRRKALEDNDLRVSQEKTKYLRYDFDIVEIANNDEVDICIVDNILLSNESFLYLESIIHKSRRIDEDLSHRIKASWMRARLKSRVSSTSVEVVQTCKRRPQSALVRRVEALVVEGLWSKGKPKLRLEDRVKHNMKKLLLSDDMTYDWSEWRARIRLCG